MVSRRVTGIFIQLAMVTIAKFLITYTTDQAMFNLL
jgi:hypothetical protein